MDTDDTNGRHRCLLRRMGGGTKRMVSVQSREGLIVARPVAQAEGKVTGDGETGGSGRSSDEAVGQQNPGEQRTRGVAV